MHCLFLSGVRLVGFRCTGMNTFTFHLVFVCLYGRQLSVRFCHTNFFLKLSRAGASNGIIGSNKVDGSSQLSGGSSRIIARNDSGNASLSNDRRERSSGLDKERTAKGSNKYVFLFSHYHQQYLW